MKAAIVAALGMSPLAFCEGNSVTIPDCGVNVAEYATAAITALGGVVGSMMPDYQVGEVVELWFSVEGCDCGFDWQGKHIAKDGFRILGLTQIKRIQ